MKKRSARSIGLLTSTALLLAACGSGSNGSGNDGGSSDELEVFSYWTSGSEEAALNVLFDAFTDENPDISIVNAAISGGGGQNAAQVLQSRIAGGTPPDTWQAMPGAVMNTYSSQGLLADVTDIVADAGLDQNMPDELLNLMGEDGKYFTAIAGNHRQNTLWFNKSTLADAGVKIDETLSWSEFVDALDALENNGVTPFCTGDKDIFASVGILEVAILAHVGADGAKDLAQGEGWDSQEVRQGVEDYLEILRHTNKDHSALTWDEAVKRMADGGCGFNMMADSAYGELLNYGAVDGETFSYVDYPGTDGMYVVLSDSFVVSESAPNKPAALEWLRVISEPDVQVAFSELKGTIPARTDVDVSSLGEYQIWAAEKYRSDRIIPTMTYGMAIGPNAQQELYDGVTQLNTSNDVDSFITKMETALNGQ